MADKQDNAPLYKKEIKLPAAIGDWTAYKPAKTAMKKIKPLFYGFHRISTKELEKTLNIHNFLSAEFAVYLKDALKASIDIFNVSIEQVTYIDFLKRVTGGLIYNKLAIKDVGEVMFLVDYQLANIMINFSLGSQSVETKIKELTELEESIIHSIFSNTVEKYTQCWGNVFEKPSFEIISYPGIQRETHINLNEVITIITAQISVANSVPASFTFVYQNSTLKKINSLLMKKNEKTPLNFASLPESLLSAIEIPVIAEVGSTKISTQEISDIENEDIISLEHRLNEPIRLMVGYTSSLKAQPGISNNRLSVKIMSSSTQKVKSALILQPGSDMIEEPAVTADTMESPEGKAKANEDDFELPLEEEVKEEYNDASENMFEEENQTPEAGGN